MFFTLSCAVGAGELMRLALMKTPILLRADDGLTWWRNSGNLESYVESPDIADGIYSAWDAEGQRLNLEAARKSFFGMSTVSNGVLSDSGSYEPEYLHSVITSHIKDVYDQAGDLPKDLPSVIALLCRLQPAMG